MNTSARPTPTLPGRRRSDSGMATAEYAVGTLGAATIGAVLIHLAGTDGFLDLLRDLFRRAFAIVDTPFRGPWL